MAPNFSDTFLWWSCACLIMLSSVKLCRCQDYILIDRGDFGTTEICGNTSFILSDLKLNGGKFKVFFRSSEEVMGEGFQMYIICFREEERDLPGLCMRMYTCVLYKTSGAKLTICSVLSMPPSYTPYTVCCTPISSTLNQVCSTQIFCGLYSSRSYI